MLTSACEKCGEAFSRPKHHRDAMRFCSRSCSVSYHNSLRPKRARTAPVHQCPRCGIEAKGGRKIILCRECVKSDTDSTTLGAVRLGRTLLSYHAKVRAHARERYQGPKKCYECNYTLHVDICHIQDLALFDDSATLGQVNSPDNLIALCKNHHWEYDNGHLEVRGHRKT